MIHSSLPTMIIDARDTFNKFSKPDVSEETEHRKVAFSSSVVRRVFIEFVYVRYVKTVAFKVLEYTLSTDD